MALDEAQLIQILKDPQKPLFAKAKACQRLAVAGTKQAVPALATLLADPQVAHYARFGLEPIPDPSVDAALRDALKKLKGKLQIGVIQSISNRRDTKAVKPLAQLLNASGEGVAEAAAQALGRIASPGAARELQKALARGKPQVKAAVAHAGLVCAEGLAAQGKSGEARALYQALSQAGVPKPVQAAAKRRLNLDL